MSRTLERTLTMLLPTAGGIPRELMDVTASLISQSRHKISNLNPTEEPAREMICAHIACQKLRTKLDLPLVSDKPPAPVPPRLYRTLFKQFSEILVVKQSQTPTATPSKRRDGTGVSEATTPSKTPSLRRKTSLAQFMPSTTKSTNKRIEPYIPVIEELCRDAPAAVFHVQDGLAFIHTSAKYANLLEEPYILLAAIYIVVVKQLTPKEVFKQMSGPEKVAWYEGQRSNTYKFMKKKGLIKMKQGDWDAKFADIMEEVSGREMVEMKWFMEIPNEGGVIADEYDDEVYEDGAMEVSGKGKRKAGEMVMESGVGSMMQDKVDFLSDKRRKAFGEWKAEVLRKIARLEA